MIELRRLTKRYGDSVVVRELSLSVAKGELLVLLGGSGSGKTTTLKMVNRLIPPSSGEVRIDGASTDGLEGHVLRRKIGYVFQKIGLFPHMTVADNVATPLSLAGWDEERTTARVTEMLEMVDLEPSIAQRLPRELSGGQAQRVGFARALAAEPKLMLLDEPFGALDPVTRDKLQQEFLAIRRRLELTAVFVTHDMVEALLIADRIAVLKEGVLVQVGTPRELLDSPADEYVERLLEMPRRQARTVAELIAGPPDEPAATREAPGGGAPP
ncbi:MAG: ABC transporter ATP-binding protein [Labilithrix sp.]|nr:ABC transporter ATP-binding protein [Labilithrix sp.]